MLCGMHIPIPVWRGVVGGARIAKSAARCSLPTFETAARTGAAGAGLSVAAAAVAARRALAQVPAYADFVHRHGGTPHTGSARTFVAGLPIMDKAGYVDAYPLAQRCRGGRLPRTGAELDESAGSSGRPYTWVRGGAELREVHRTMALLARHLLADGGDTGPVVTLNAFSMGAWATGTNVSRSLARIGAVKSTGPDAPKILATMRLLGASCTYVIAGYPPFLRELLDEAARCGMDLSAYRMHGFVGGEGMSEALRTRLETVFRDVYSAYGASDLDIGVAAETPMSVWLRRQAAANPAFAARLFGTTGRLPMVFQYDPTDYHVETIGGELVVTVCRPSMLSPRIRYNIHDAGGAATFARVTQACREFGLRYTGPGVFRLPFLFVHGRSDSTVSVHGANIYPEDVEWGLGEAAAAHLVTGYALDVDEDADGVTRPVVHVETTQPGNATLTADLAEAVRRRLLANSADFRAAVAETAHAGEIVIRLHAPGTGPFLLDATRIKRRYVVGRGERSEPSGVETLNGTHR
jgi:phenylacetate-CoA ligase